MFGGPRVGTRPSWVVVSERFEESQGTRVAEFVQGFGFDLSDALSGDAQDLSDCLEGLRLSVYQSEAEEEYELFAFLKGAEQVIDGPPEVDGEDDGFGVDWVFVGEEVAEHEVADAGTEAVVGRGVDGIHGERSLKGEADGCGEEVVGAGDRLGGHRR